MPKGTTFHFVATPLMEFDLRGITKELQAALDVEAKEHRNLLRKTTAKWSGVKPQFRSKTTVSKQQVSVSTYPYGEGEGAWKWRWLEEGTKTRWALMTKDFKPKTRRGFLGSSTGRGGVVLVGKRAMMARGIAARPGIEARNWIAEVNKERSRKFKGLLQRAFDHIAVNTIKPSHLRKP